MYQLTQLASEVHRQRLASAAQQRPAQRLLGNRRATRRTGAHAPRRPAALAVLTYRLTVLTYRAARRRTASTA
jgi:hypothetical protein